MVDVGRLGIGESGVNGVVAAEVHEGVVGGQRPVAGQFIADFGISLPLLEVHAVDAAVRAVVSAVGQRGEAAVAGGDCSRGYGGVIAAVLRCE